MVEARDSFKPFALRECLWCSGLFLLLSFSTVSSLLGESNAPMDAARVFPEFSPFVRALAFLAIALVAAKAKTLLNRRVLLGVCAGIVGLCALLRGAAGATVIVPDTVPVVPLAMLALQNIAYAVLYLAWMELYAQIDIKRCLLCLGAAHLFSSLLSYIVFLSGSFAAVLVCAAAGPAVSVAMLCRADGVTREGLYRLGAPQEGEWHISARPVVLLMAFTLMNTFLRNSLEVADKAFVLLGVSVAAALILVAALARFERFELKLLYEVAVPVLVAGAMCFMAGGPAGPVAAAFCSNAAFTLFIVFITVVFCAVSFRYGVSALWLMGIAQAALTFGSALGSLLAQWERAGEVEAVMPTVAVLVVGLVALSMLLVSDRDFATTWGVVPKGGENAPSLPVVPEDALQQRCAKIARNYGLTRREEEILELMMEGLTLAAISEKLYVAESTMKTHSRHIYRKAGVANRQELQALVEAYPL